MEKCSESLRGSELMGELTPEKRAAIEEGFIWRKPEEKLDVDREPGCLSNTNVEDIATHFFDCITYLGNPENHDCGSLMGCTLHMPSGS